jgi:ribonuclease HII
MGRSIAPTTELEADLCRSGAVVGLDEVGRGAWAGPLTVGAVVLDSDDLGSLQAVHDPRSALFARVRDSKVLSERLRESLHDELIDQCRWAIGEASHEECDQLGMADAQRLATARALSALRDQGVEPLAAIADGRWDFVGSLVPKVVMRVKADRDCVSVAMASIVAKVRRDRLMRELADHFPAWHFHTNKGYPCPRHRAAVLGYGPSAIHRRSWVFMDKQPWTGVVRSSAGLRLF